MPLARWICQDREQNGRPIAKSAPARLMIFSVFPLNLGRACGRSLAWRRPIAWVYFERARVLCTSHRQSLAAGGRIFITSKKSHRDDQRQERAPKHRGADESKWAQYGHSKWAQDGLLFLLSVSVLSSHCLGYPKASRGVQKRPEERQIKFKTS